MRGRNLILATDILCCILFRFVSFCFFLGGGGGGEKKKKKSECGDGGLGLREKKRGREKTYWVQCGKGKVCFFGRKTK